MDKKINKQTTVYIVPGEVYLSEGCHVSHFTWNVYVLNI